MITLGLTHYNRSVLVEELLSKISHLPNGVELLIVDDCSRDDEWRRLIELLKQTKLQYKLVRHETNKGPGAAKNSLFTTSDTKYVFILDSDNAIDMNSLQYIYNYAREHDVDLLAPAGISYFYSDFKTRRSTYHRTPCLANMETYLLGDEIYNNGNMLISRKAWEIAGGYPEYHTLDTQGFGFRLRAANIAYRTLPQASYFHRFHSDLLESQFMRTSESGSISIEQFLILVEFFSTIPGKIQQFILNYPILHPVSWEESLFSKINKFLAADSNLTIEKHCTESASAFLHDYLLNANSTVLLDDCSLSAGYKTLIEYLGKGYLRKSEKEKKDILRNVSQVMSNR